MECSFLLITTEGTSSKWVDLLRNTLAPFGELIIQPSMEAERSEEKCWKGIMIDAGIEEDPALLTNRLKKNYPGVRVIVFTAAPTWEQVREALHAGADDYIGKEVDEITLRDNLIEVFGLRSQE